MAQARSPQRPLERGADRLLGGVCSGLADRFAIDPLVVRLAFVGLAFLNGVGVFLYLLLWLVMPSSSDARRRGLA